MVDDARAFFAAASGIERHPIESREAWLELRKRDLTASTIGALFGVHPYETIAGLHAAKLGLELPGPDPESDVIRRGNALERIVPEELASKMPATWRLERANVYLRDRHLRLGATPDFWILGDPRGLGVLQTKSVAAMRFTREWGEEGSAPPLWIGLQNATEMMLSGAVFGAIGVLVVGDYTWKPYLVEVPRHAGSERRIREAVSLFWAKLEAGEMPAVDYTRDGDLIALMFPHERPGSIIDLRHDNRIGELLEERERQGGLIKEAQMRKEVAENEIKQKLGDHEAALVRGWRVSWKEQNRKAYAVAASSFRVLRSTRDQGA